jgi:cytochrome c-type biogenesis protein CcmF
MTFAHIGLGVFLLGASIDGTGKVETAKVMAIGDQIDVGGGYHLALDHVGQVDGPNYIAQRGTLSVTKAGKPICTALPERRLYPTGGTTTSKVALCLQGVSDVYVVFGEQRLGANGLPGWLVRVYWNPWARLIFLGPLLMAMGGGISLSDRRLRIGLPKRAASAKGSPVLGPAE